MLCRCKKCLEKIDGTLSDVYSHLMSKHDLYVYTIHDAEQYICFQWNDDAVTYNILIPEKIKDLVKEQQYQKFFGGNYKCPCCRKNVSGGFEFMFNGKSKFLICNNCVHSEIGVMIGDVVIVEDSCSAMTKSIKIQQESVSKDIIVATPESPMGKGMLGRKTGDTIEIETPRRKLRLRIISIR